MTFTFPSPLPRARAVSARPVAPLRTDDSGVCEAKEPGRERCPPPFDPAQGIQHTDEHLFRQVLRVTHILRTGEHVAVDTRKVRVIQLSDGSLIAGSGGVHKGADRPRLRAT